MTFNIRYASAKDVNNSWISRKHLVAETLADFNPDMFGLQEVELQQLNDLQYLLPQYISIGVARGDGKQAGEFSPIFYNPSHFQLLEQDTFWFSETPEIPGSMSWGNFIPRICSWGRFKNIATGTTFYLYNMHWDHASQTAREKSAQLVIKTIRQRKHLDDPVIVMGDFNAGPGNNAYDSFLQSSEISLIDSFSKLHNQPQGTFHGFSGNAVLPRIDAILVSKELNIKSSSVLTTHDKGRYPSDHFPVTTIIDW